MNVFATEKERIGESSTTDIYSPFWIVWMDGYVEYDDFTSASSSSFYGKARREEYDGFAHSCLLATCALGFIRLNCKRSVWLFLGVESGGDGLNI